MQPLRPQKPGATAPTSRKGSLSAIFSKKNLSFSRKYRGERIDSPTIPPPTPEQQGPKPGDPNGYVGPYTRVARNAQPTEEDLKTYSDTLRQQLAEAWPHRDKSRYKKVYALLVCWADNDPSRYPPRYAAPPQSHPSQGSPTLRGQQSCMALRSSYASDDVRSVRRTSSRFDMREAATTVGRHGPFVAAALDLNGVFERRYEYNSQIWLVPNLGDPQEALTHKLRQFVTDYGSPDNLLIFWYGGNAEFIGNFNRDSYGGALNGGDVIWYGLRDEVGIQARAAAKVLANSKSDVWMINDSPFAQHAYVPHAAGPGSFEMLGSGSLTPSNLEMDRARECSLTRKLSLMLDSPYLAANGVSILELHRKLLDMQAFRTGSSSSGTAAAASHYATVRSSGGSSTTGTGTTRSLRVGGGPRGSGGSASNPNNAHNNEDPPPTPTTPTQIINDPRIPARCKRFGTPAPHPIYCQVAPASGVERGVMRNIIISRLDTTLAAPGQQHNAVRFQGGEDTMVRLDVKLNRPTLDVRLWKEWVLRAPVDAAGVKLKVVSSEAVAKEAAAAASKKR
ncbi:hypothetical protein F5Y17DRAFT_101827 [Xylariaceae sp. FL0594]|nr:hypothetical protein F5Y17DRAFT_101827 [Xylariaceae sp. FL0594]